MNRMIEEIGARVPNRRKFMNRIALAGAAMGLSTQTARSQGPAITDADILNFALNLEYLEAEFYTVATTGKSIDQMGIEVGGPGSSGATTGGAKVNFTSGGGYTDIINEIAFDERQHVKLIRGALTRLV